MQKQQKNKGCRLKAKQPRKYTCYIDYSKLEGVCQVEDEIWAELEDIAYQDYVFEEMIKKEAN